MSAPLEVLVEAAAVLAPANAVVPVNELRGAIVFGVAVVIVVVAAVLDSARGTVAGAATAPVLRTAVSLDWVVVLLGGDVETAVEEDVGLSVSSGTG